MEAVNMGVVLNGVAVAIISASVIGVAKLWSDFKVAQAERRILVAQNQSDHTALFAGQSSIIEELKGINRKLSRMEALRGAEDGND